MAESAGAERMSVPFLILAAVTLASACTAMLLRGLVHCALALAVTFAGLGALYLALGAQFLGLAQLLVYVGAIAVLIVFVILLTRGGETAATLLSPAPPWVLGILVSAAIFAILAWAIIHSSAIHSVGSPASPPSIRQLGDVLMQDYVLPLELIGLMLTAALIGAVIVAMKEKQGTE
jgi:NADH-quinone oxidoreductase subunit J